MSVEIRVCPPGRFEELLRMSEVAFAEDASDDIKRVEAVADKERFLGAIEDDRFVGTAGVFDLQLSVPGGEMACGGVTWVSVLPTHRRRGLMSQMMRLMIDDCHRRGEPIAALWAAEGAIYQRFGFGLGTLALSIEADSRAFRFAREWPEEGQCRLLQAGEGREIVEPIYEPARRERTGFLRRPPQWWPGFLPDVEKDKKGGEARRLVVFETGGRAEAYAVYKTKAEWGAHGPNHTLGVEEAISSTPGGTRAIWRYLMGVDLVRTVRASRLSIDHPLLMLAAEPRALGARTRDGLWVRIVDASAALSGRTYGVDGHGSGRLILDLRDDYCPWNAGRWVLSVEDGRGRVERTEAEADLALDANDLASLFLGGFSASELAIAGRVVELRARGIATADALFPTALKPWCPQMF
jgi:predicted acetyltransferase